MYKDSNDNYRIDDNYLDNKCKGLAGLSNDNYPYIIIISRVKKAFHQKRPEYSLSMGLLTFIGLLTLSNNRKQKQSGWSVGWLESYLVLIRRDTGIIRVFILLVQSFVQLLCHGLGSNIN